jgi:amino acid transporter
MHRLLPLVFLSAFATLFGLMWIVIVADPHSSPWYIFAGFDLLLFSFVFCALGMFLYFVRIRFYKRYDPSWYFKTSFKMAFFAALFLAIIVQLTISQLLTLFNLLGVILAVGLFAFWSYLGKKN